LRFLIIAQEGRQSPLGLSLFLDILFLLRSCALTVHLLETRIRLFGFPGQQCRIVAVRLANNVSQEVRVRLGGSRFQSAVGQYYETMCRSVALLLRLVQCDITVRRDAPLRIEGIDTDKLVLLCRMLCVLLQQLCDVSIIVNILGHD